MAANADVAVARQPRSAWVRRALSSPSGAALTAGVAFLLVWQVVTVLAPRVPTPWAVLDFLYIEMTGGSHGGIIVGEFWTHFAATLRRFGVGLTIGFVSGVLVGVLIGVSALARAVLNDTIIVLMALPAFVWAFLTTMWFGIDWKSPVATVSLTAFPFVVVNIAQGVRSIDPGLREMSAAFGVRRVKRFRHLTLAAIYGYIFAGLRFAFILSWNAVLLSEWFAGQDGVGFRTRYWFDANRYRGFLGWVIAFIAFIVILDRFVLNQIQKRAFRWRGDDMHISKSDLDALRAGD